MVELWSVCPAESGCQVCRCNGETLGSDYRQLLRCSKRSAIWYRCMQQRDRPCHACSAGRYSITLSARRSTTSGTASPSALEADQKANALDVVAIARVQRARQALLHHREGTR